MSVLFRVCVCVHAYVDVRVYVQPLRVQLRPEHSQVFDLYTSWAPLDSSLAGMCGTLAQSCTVRICCSVAL